MAEYGSKEMPKVQPLTKKQYEFIQEISLPFMIKLSGIKMKTAMDICEQYISRGLVAECSATKDSDEKELRQKEILGLVIANSPSRFPGRTSAFSDLVEAYNRQIPLARAQGAVQKHKDADQDILDQIQSGKVTPICTSRMTIEEIKDYLEIYGYERSRLSRFNKMQLCSLLYSLDPAKFNTDGFFSVITDPKSDKAVEWGNVPSKKNGYERYKSRIEKVTQPPKDFLFEASRGQKYPKNQPVANYDFA